MRLNTRSRLTTTTGALTGAAALVVLVSACGGGDTDVSAQSSTTVTPAAAAPAAGSSGEAVPADTEHNAADVMFVQMMIPHHEQAVVMAEDALGEDGVAPGEDPAVVDLATRIKAAQQPEIDVMTTWLEDWGMAAVMEGDSMAGMDHSMPGGMSEEDMIELRAATGADFDRLWLKMMIEHHTGAIDMAEDVLADGTSQDVKTLAEQIISSQQSEIVEMEALLTDA